jgi:DNA-directed RNA polymerase alpha subunit
MTEPTIGDVSRDSNGNTLFVLSNADVSYANALRRTMISDIPIFGFKTTPYEENKCKIFKNTSRFNNEILKHRLSCIPLCFKNINIKDHNYKEIYEYEPEVNKYKLEVKINNNTDEMLMVTTKDFKIVSKDGKDGKDTQINKQLFPYYTDGGLDYYIDFVRLRPSYGDVEGEEIHLECDIELVSARDDSCFNVVGTCSYGYTIDTNVMNEEKKNLETQLESNGKSQDEISIKIKNWELLDARRTCIKANSFDFVVQTVDENVYENLEIVLTACSVLIKKITNIEMDLKHVESMLNTMDIIIQNEDYTIGNMINHLLYENYYNTKEEETQIFAFVAFKKQHPHDKSSKIRVTFKTRPTDLFTSLNNILADTKQKLIRNFEQLKTQINNKRVG